MDVSSTRRAVVAENAPDDAIHGNILTIEYEVELRPLKREKGSDNSRKWIKKMKIRLTFDGGRPRGRATRIYSENHVASGTKSK